MPEGPSIYILKENTLQFKGKKVLEAVGNGKLDYDLISGKKVTDIKSWGKQYFICFKGFYVRVHFLLFGSYMINEQKEAKARLSLYFSNGELHLYTSGIKIVEGAPENNYDFSSDVLSENWNAKEALKKIRSVKKLNVCDALMDQQIFSGVGNIIKNEVLFRIRVHPNSTTDKLPAPKLRQLVKEAEKYSWDFYNWKIKNQLKKHWLIYKKADCTNCGRNIKSGDIGKSKRYTYWCNHCQILYK